MCEILLDDQFVFVCQNLQLIMSQSCVGDLALNEYHSVVDTRGISKSVSSWPWCVGYHVTCIACLLIIKQGNYVVLLSYVCHTFM